jgi:hypothetical protein
MHARQASRQAKRRQAAALQNGLGTREWIATFSAVPERRAFPIDILYVRSSIRIELR